MTLYQLRLLWAYKDGLRTRIPFLFRRLVEKSRRQTEEAAARLKEKDVLDVAFFLPIPGMWKADYLFRLMEKHPKYHPYIVIYPYSKYKGFNEDEIFSTIRRTENFVRQRGFEYIIPYDEEKHCWKDVKKEYHPDIVFFCSPYRDTDPKYYVYHFMDALTCYISYSFVSLNLYDLHYRTLAVNLYGMCFEETETHREFACRYGRNAGINAVTSGYPGTEVYLHKEYVPAEVWKPQPHPKKRVIWAPHHTINECDGFCCSTFLNYYEHMLQLAEKYKDTIQFAFKPHQLLKFKLMKLWGEERALDYYQRWADMENTQLEEAGYVDLFIGSDAMIHDSGSFTTEYLFQKKPVMYLFLKNDPSILFNEFGKKSFEQHYHGKCVEDIENFLQKVVLEGKDELSQSRQAFFEEYLAPKDGLMPSEKIMQLIEEKINGKK